MAPIIAAYTHKGGTGKTTLASTVAAGASRRGLRVLLLDGDMQGNCSMHFGVPREHRVPGSGMTQVILDAVPVEELARPVEQFPGLDLVVGDQGLSAVDLSLGQRMGAAAMRGEQFAFSRQLALSLENVQADDSYDVIVVDCPPGFGGIVSNVLAVADHLVVPVVLEPFAVEGLEDTRAALQAAERGLGAHATVTVVLQMVDLRTALAKQIHRDLTENPDIRPLLAATQIPRAIRMAEASAFGRVIFNHVPNSSSAAAYDALTAELVERFRIGPVPPRLTGTITSDLTRII